jgi:D-alanine-D-alanine ligase-like ATP-grasp enzyme
MTNVPTEPKQSDIQKFVNRVHQRTGLTLYGVDLIQDATTGVYYAIDVNVFPS